MSVSGSVQFVKPTTAMLEYIADNLRAADTLEVWEMSRQSPIDAIMEGLERSSYCSIVVVNGIPCAVVGLVEVDILTGTGVPWLLGTDYVVQNLKVFLKNSKQGLIDMLNVCPNLYNYVHAENQVSVRWLKYMGFKIDAPVNIGIGGALFHRFTIGEC